MTELRKREIKTGVITTKGRIFAEKILKQLNIFPEFIFGYESGTKIKIAEKLTQTYEFLQSNNLPDGIAFGSAARKIMQPLIEFAHKNNKKLYEYPEIMALAIKKAQKFLEPWKSSSFK